MPERVPPVEEAGAQGDEAALAATETIAGAQDDEDALSTLTACFGQALGARAAMAVAEAPSGESAGAQATWCADPEASKLLAVLEHAVASGRLGLTGPDMEILEASADDGLDRDAPGAPWALAMPVATGAEVEGALFAALDGPSDHQGSTLALASSFAPLASICLRHAAQTEELKHVARFDALTGCLNRTTILDTLEAEYARSERQDHPLSVCFLDLDGFKAINDNHGHLTGDRVLAAVGAALRDAIREYDSAGRFGGDEFLVVMPETDERDASAIARRLARSVREHTDAAEGPRVGATYGVASRGREKAPAKLLARADARLLKSKGRRARTTRRFSRAVAGGHYPDAA